MRLPDFPWDHLVSYKEKARSHPYGLVDLSVGTPVDATPAVVRHALAGAADSPGYPLTAGTPDLREAAAGWLARRLGVLVEPSAVLPVLGTKELVAQLPSQLGLEPGDRVWVPTPAYPTYEVGALLAHCEPVVGPAEGVALVWLNSPGNPTGRVLSVDEMRAVVTWARERGVIVASDECYIELGWEARAVSVLHPDVCGGSHEGLLAVHSLSKRSNLAGYRAGFVTGDPELVDGLLQLRKHAGLMMPSPVQAAATAALADDMHVADQRARYANRRAVLAAALAVAGFTIDHSEAGLYLWATRGEDCWATVDALSSVGVLVAPGSFYGESGRRHVRVALTAPDAQIATVPERMTMLPAAGAPSGAQAAPGWGQQPGGYPPAGPPGPAASGPHPVGAGRGGDQGWSSGRPSGYGAGEPARADQSSVGSFDRYRSSQPDPGARPSQDYRPTQDFGSAQEYRQPEEYWQPEEYRQPQDFRGGRDVRSGQPGDPYRDPQGAHRRSGSYSGAGEGAAGQGTPPPYQTGQLPVPSYENGGGSAPQQQPPLPYQTGQMAVPPYQTGQMPVPPYQTGQMPVPPYETGQMPVPVPPYETGQMPVPVPPYETGQMAVPRPGGGEQGDRNTPGWGSEPDVR
ncbi:Aminotransferase [Frankia sp. Hr75.2]|nr:Aminotransferase [Frankia sp. Hr75.2]